MKNLIKNYLINKMIVSFHKSEAFIKNLIEKYCQDKNNLKILDIGCGDCQLTKYFFSNVYQNNEIHGLDLSPDCQADFIIYHQADLENTKLPFTNQYFDIVLINQVIEHILNKDQLVAECYRILKFNGFFILATENIASFDNIISLILGQEPISQHTSSRLHTNSFLSPHFMKKIDHPDGNKYAHKNICSYYGLQRLARINGFTNLKIKSFGNISNILEKLFPIHNRLILIYGFKNPATETNNNQTNRKFLQNNANF